MICDSILIKPLLAIELDDSSHNNKKQKEKDKFKDDALETAGLPILRLPARYSYNLTDLKDKIFNELYPAENKITGDKEICNTVSLNSPD